MKSTSLRCHRTDSTFSSEKHQIIRFDLWMKYSFDAFWWICLLFISCRFIELHSFVRSLIKAIPSESERAHTHIPFIYTQFNCLVLNKRIDTYSTKKNPLRTLKANQMRKFFRRNSTVFIRHTYFQQHRIRDRTNKKNIYNRFSFPTTLSKYCVVFVWCCFCHRWILCVLWGGFMFIFVLIESNTEEDEDDDNDDK